MKTAEKRNQTNTIKRGVIQKRLYSYDDGDTIGISFPIDNDEDCKNIKKE